MSHIMLKAMGAGPVGLSMANLDFHIFTSEKWYMDSILQFTNGSTDIDAGTFAAAIVTYDYGSF